MNPNNSKELVKSSRGVSKGCFQCQKPFDIFVREHICKRCLKAVCSACSPTKDIIPNYDSKHNDKHRICKSCACENDFQRALIKDYNLSYGQTSTISLRWLVNLKLISSADNQSELAELERVYESQESIELIQKIDITRMKQVLSYSYRDFAYKIQQKETDEEVQRMLVTLLNKLAVQLLWRRLPNKFHVLGLFFLAFATPGQAFALLTYIYQKMLPQYALDFINSTGQLSLGLKKTTQNQKTKIVQMTDYLIKIKAIEEIEEKNFKLFLNSIGIELASMLFVDLLTFECSYEAIDLMIAKNSFLEIEKLLVLVSQNQSHYIRSSISESRDTYSLILLHLIRNTSFTAHINSSRSNIDTPSTAPASSQASLKKAETITISEIDSSYDDHVANAVNESLLKTEIPIPSREFIEGMRRQRAMSVDGFMHTSQHKPLKNIRELEAKLKNQEKVNEEDEDDEEVEVEEEQVEIAVVAPTPIVSEVPRQAQMLRTESLVSEAFLPMDDEYKSELIGQIEMHKSYHQKSEQRSQYLVRELESKEKLYETLGKLVSQKDSEITQLKQQSSECLHLHNRTALDRLWKEILAMQNRNEQLREQLFASKQMHEKERNELLVASQNLVTNSKVSLEAAAKLAKEAQNKLQDENASLLSLLSEREGSIVKKDSEIILLRQQILTVTEEKDRSKELQDSIRNQLQSKSQLAQQFQSSVNSQVTMMQKNIQDLHQSHESALEMQRNLMRWDSEKHVLELEELNALLRQHEDTISTLRKELADLNTLSNQQLALISEQKTQLAETEKAKGLCEQKLHEHSHEICKHESTIAELNKQVAEQKEIEHFLREDIRRLVEFVELRDRRIEDISAINEWNKQRSHEFEELSQSSRGRILELESISDDNNLTIATLNAQINEMSAKNSKVQEELTKELAETKQHLQSEQHKLKETSDDLHHTKKHLAELTEKHEHTHHENEHLKKENHSLKEQLANQTERGNTAESSLAQLKEDHKQLQEKMESDRIALENKFAERIKEAERVSSENEQLNQKYNELLADRDRLSHENKHKDQTIEQQHEKQHHREKEFHRLQDTLKERDCEIDEKDKIIEELRKQLKNTEEKLANTQEDLNKYLSIFVSVKNTVVNVDPNTKSSN